MAEDGEAQPDEPAYAVGYGKPPVETRFRKGASGNPRGRARGQRSFIAEVEEILREPVNATRNGRKKRISSARAVLELLRQKALSGDARAMDRFLELAAQVVPATVLEDMQASLDEDRQLVEQFKASLVIADGAGGEGGGV